jgi:hypothetical protein
MLSRRSLFAAPAALVALAGTAVAVPAPAMSRESALALIKGRIDTALGPYGASPWSKWDEAPDVVRTWLFFSRQETPHFEWPDGYLQHQIKTFFYNGRMSKLLKMDKLVDGRSRLHHPAQLMLPQIFPLELHEFDQEFTQALLTLNPKS